MRLSGLCGVPLSDDGCVLLGTSGPMSLAYIDMQPSAAQISQRLDTVRASCQNLVQLWHVRKMKLEQCFQLRLFESDIEKVWSPFLYSVLLFLYCFCIVFNAIILYFCLFL